MIIDSKYHTASLAAVFLALGIGIVIGSLLVGERITENILDEQESLVARLEEDYFYLKEQRRQAHEEYQVLEKTLDIYKQYARESLPAVIGGRLTGEKIMLVKDENKALPDFMEDNFRIAGAEVILCDTNAGGAINLAGMGTFYTSRTAEDLADIDAFVLIDLKNSPGAVPEEISTRQERLFIDSPATIPEQVALILALAKREG